MQKFKVVCGLLCAVAGLARAAEDQVAAADVSRTPAQYDFDYAVNDPLTGDLKDQRESRSGDNVVGYYRTLDADGFVRTVRYQADAVNGFQADVVREPVPGGAGAPDLAAGASAAAAAAKVDQAVAPPSAAYPPAFYRGLPSAYPYAAYPPSYHPYAAAYQPYSSRARLVQPYSPPYAAHRHPYAAAQRHPYAVQHLPYAAQRLPYAAQRHPYAAQHLPYAAYQPLRGFGHPFDEPLYAAAPLDV